MPSFSDLGLSQKVLSAVEGAGYTEPTPIQEQAIPHALERRDVLGIAQTGTGKTASFVLPMLTMLEKGRARARMPRTLIIEPTRELAAQVEESFTKYSANQKMNVALLIGGMSFEEQDRKIDRGADVLIATPGRLLDHFERGKLLLTGVEILVIDEADRMLDMGFIPDIERICNLLPFTRQTLFFSATMPPEITRLTEQFLQNPIRVEVAKQASAAQTVEQRLVAARGKDYDKRETLRELINSQDDLTNAIVFCNRKRDVSTLYRSLEKHGFSAGALHGDMDQRARMTMLHNFRNDKISILVASDVAARGLDIPAVSHVFNFDVPVHAEDYVHRIGRTGRAGRSGKAFTLVTKSDQKYVDSIEKLIGTDIVWAGTPVGELVDEDADAGPEGAKSSRRGKAGGRSKARGEKKSAEKKAVAEPVAEAASDEPGPAVAETTDSAAEKEAVGAVPREAEREARATENGESNTRKRGGSNRSRGGNGRAQSNRGRGKQNEDTKAPVGFGDDIPAFMLIATGA